MDENAVSYSMGKRGVRCLLERRKSRDVCMHGLPSTARNERLRLVPRYGAVSPLHVNTLVGVKRLQCRK